MESVLELIEIGVWIAYGGIAVLLVLASIQLYHIGD